MFEQNKILAAILHKILAGGILALKGACAQLAAVYEHEVAARGVRFGVC